MGFFDSVSNFFQPISAPLVQLSTRIGGTLLDSTLHTNAVSQAFAKPESQQLGQQLFAAGSLAAIGIGAGAVAAPLLAGASLSSLGGVGALSGIAAKVLPTVLGPNQDDSDEGVLTEEPQDISLDDLGSASDADWSF